MLYDYSKCKKCDHLNPPYKSNCEICKSYLRDKIVNIDFWNILRLLIEEPSTAFRLIVFSENKNFVFFIFFLIVLKNLIISRFLSVPNIGAEGVTTLFAIVLILSSVITSTQFAVQLFFQGIIYKKISVELRYKDIFALNVYSYTPYIFGLIFIFPVAITVFGRELFSNNPYPYEIKPFIAYILFILEFILISWSILLNYFSVLITLKNKIVSLFITFTALIFWVFTLFLSSMFIFTI